MRRKRHAPTKGPGNLQRLQTNSWVEGEKSTGGLCKRGKNRKSNRVGRSRPFRRESQENQRGKSGRQGQGVGGSEESLGGGYVVSLNKGQDYVSLIDIQEARIPKMSPIQFLYGKAMGRNNKRKKIRWTIDVSYKRRVKNPGRGQPVKRWGVRSPNL